MPKYEIIEKHIERRTYIKGKFSGKFIGYFDPRKSDVKHENFFDLDVISGEIKTIKNKTNLRHWQTGEPEEFQDIEKFLTKLPENLPLKIIDENNTTTTYTVNLNDKKISQYKLSNQVYENNKIFGDISGIISGYLKHYDTEYIEVEKKEAKQISTLTQKIKTNRQTGNTEVKNNYKRWEYYYSNNSTFWGDWQKQNNSSYSYSLWQTLGLIIKIVIAVFVIVPLLIFGWKIIVPIAILIGAVYVLSVLGNIIVYLFKWSFRIIGTVYIIYLIFSIINLFSNPLTTIQKKKTVLDDAKEVSETNPILNDSIISHYRIWKDYANNKYKAHLKIRVSDYHNASYFRNNLSIPLNSTTNYDKIVSNIYKFDTTRLDLIYNMLENIQNKNELNRLQFAEVIVSLIQDIPYTLILNDACNASIYNDDFIRDYINKKGECQDYTKYGIFSPVEFLATLKGDCDTRTLLLFTIFNHFNYDVVMLSSELYKHSIIGINLPYKGISKSINGKNYIVWETTSQGIPPGIISRKISDMRFWDVSLITSKKLSI
jgi:hypothetical protein